MKKLKLSHRILMSMLVLIFFSFIAVGVTTTLRYQTKNKQYHQDRLKRKDRAVVQSIKYMTQRNKPSLIQQFEENEAIKNIAHIHKLNLNIYDMGDEGLRSPTLVASSIDTLNLNQEIPKQVFNSIIKKIKQGGLGVREIENKEDGTLEIYTVLYDIKNQPYAILNIPYDVTELNNINEEIKAEVLVLLKLYSFLFIMAGLIAVFLLRQITKPLKIVTQKLKNVEITKQNEPIFWPVNDELGMLISQYNKLIQELKEKAEKLAKSERKSAWKKMAKQIAHEIKNPLTPMKLSVQHFQKTIRKEDENFDQKIKHFTSTMIQQINTMSKVAAAFSNFASVTKEFSERFLLQKEIAKIADLYKKDNVSLHNSEIESYVKIDKTHLTRILNNLIKNAIQSISNQKTKKIKLAVVDLESFWRIEIQDNGKGIANEIKDKIFEPNFTTKTSGMGLGLAMVKNIINDFQGEISFITKLDEGTTFFVDIPKSN